MVYLILICIGCKKEVTTPPQPATHNIKYEVSGGAASDITYDGTIIYVSQPTWDYTFTRVSGGAMSLSATTYPGVVSVTIRIYEDGVLTHNAQGTGTQSLIGTVK